MSARTESLLAEALSALLQDWRAHHEALPRRSSEGLQGQAEAALRVYRAGTGNRVDGLEAEVERLKAQVQEMEEAPLNLWRKQRNELADALDKLRSEVEGLGAFDTEVIQAIGHTNWNVLQLRKQEAETALRSVGKLPPLAASPTGEVPRG